MPIIKKAADGEKMSVRYPIMGAKTAYIKLLEEFCIDMTVARW